MDSNSFGYRRTHTHIYQSISEKLKHHEMQFYTGYHSDTIKGTFTWHRWCDASCKALLLQQESEGCLTDIGSELGPWKYMAVIWKRVFRYISILVKVMIRPCEGWLGRFLTSKAHIYIADRFRNSRCQNIRLRLAKEPFPLKTVQPVEDVSCRKRTHTFVQEWTVRRKGKNGKWPGHLLKIFYLG